MGLICRKGAHLQNGWGSFEEWGGAHLQNGVGLIRPNMDKPLTLLDGTLSAPNSCLTTLSNIASLTNAMSSTSPASPWQPRLEWNSVLRAWHNVPVLAESRPLRAS